MLYVGVGLAAVGSHLEPEPALINPKLKVQFREQPVLNPTPDYWPAYHNLSPLGRGAYLQWLAGGRRDPQADIGLVFLFFYGLERRVLTDSRSIPAAKAEIAAIRAEVERLLEVYGSNGSFRAYATGFLDAAALVGDGIDGAFSVRSASPYEMPLALKVVLGRLVASGQSVPAALARQWAEHHPEVYFRTPSQRCADEFKRLFDIRFGEHYGEGMGLDPVSRLPALKAEYRPASGSYHSTIRVDVGDLPDVSSFSRPVQELASLTSAVEEELDPYSRFLGRNPDQRDSLRALALLPEVLLRDHPSAALARLKQWLSGYGAREVGQALNAGEFLAHWSFENSEKPRKAELTAYLQLLSRLGFGVEPDVRFDGPKPDPDSRVVVFRLPSNAPAAPSREYAAVATIVRLAAAVMGADGEISETEERVVEQHLGEVLDLSGPEKARLKAHLTWLLSNPRDIAEARRAVASLDRRAKANAAHLMTALANADGRVDPQEVRLLEKVYKLLGLPESQVRTDLGVESGQREEPVVVERAEPGIEFALPKQKEAAGITLDMSRVERTMAETRDVQILLSQIFVEEQMEAANGGPHEATLLAVEGLDSSHSRLLCLLAAQPQWSLADYEILCAEVGVLPSGAAEALNEFSFERSDEPLLDGEDPITIDQTIAKELLQ
jgi:uncharacterized tellurite resistance protein B-like protein